MFWLVYQNGKGVEVVVLPASALIYARLDAVNKGLDGGTFKEGHLLDAKLSKRVPKKMIGRRLSPDEAQALLSEFE